jgi:hypothetical protein
MRRLASWLALTVTALFVSAPARAGLVQVDFSGVITDAPDPEESVLPDPPTIGQHFTGHFSYDEANVSLVTTDEGSYYKLVFTSPIELSFGGLSNPLLIADTFAGDGVHTETCAAPCDTWTLSTGSGPHLTQLGFFFEDATATQVTGSGFFVPADLGGWTRARLEVSTIDGLSGYFDATAEIDSWHTVPEPSALAPLALLVLAAGVTRRRESANP